MTPTLEELKYPIGKFVPPESYSTEILATWIEEIAALPALLCNAIEGLSDAQLDAPYREGGWTVRQVVHHLADSHLNAYCRLKLALTEEAPIVKPYVESRWAELPDGKEAPLEPSLKILEGVHQRWVMVMKLMQREAFERTYVHPQYGKEYPVAYLVGLYAWHGKHHVRHIQGLRERMRW